MGLDGLSMLRIRVPRARLTPKGPARSMSTLTDALHTSAVSISHRSSSRGRQGEASLASSDNLERMRKSPTYAPSWLNVLFGPSANAASTRESQATTSSWCASLRRQEHERRTRAPALRAMNALSSVDRSSNSPMRLSKNSPSRGGVGANESAELRESNRRRSPDHRKFDFWAFRPRSREPRRRSRSSIRLGSKFRR